VSPDRLLRLYPRAWRERYGEEFLALVEDQAIGPRQVLDIVSGAIDARLTRTVPAPERAPTSEQGGTAVMNALRERLCETDTRFTTRDSLIGAAIVIGVGLLGAWLNAQLGRAGYDAAAEAVVLFATSGGLLVSLPFWLTKGQPVKAQAVVVGVPLVLLATIAVVKAMV
jgi:hypothetical protein